MLRELELGFYCRQFLSPGARATGSKLRLLRGFLFWLKCGNRTHLYASILPYKFAINLNQNTAVVSLIEC